MSLMPNLNPYTHAEEERPLLDSSGALPPLQLGDSSDVIFDTASPSASSLIPPGEHRRFLLRLDFCLLTWAWFAYLFKQIDSSNYKTAYASGMKEDLKLNGNELNYMDTYYRIGYGLFVLPSQFLMTKYRPSLYLPSLEIVWGILTGFMALARDTRLIYPLRFFIGVAEASSYPGILSILTNWYTSDELATRVAIFGTSYPASSIFVGFMQAALHKGMDGSLGLAGWRWLFIFNAIMTVFFACAGFLMIPDHPNSSRAFWLTTEQKRIAKKRMQDAGRQVELSGITLDLVKYTFSTWPLYLFTAAFSLYTWSQVAPTWIQLFLMAEKNSDGSRRFSIEEINLIPIGAWLIMILFMILFTRLSDKTGHRVRYILFQQAVLLLGCITLATWPSSFGLKIAAFFAMFTCYSGGHILIAWMTDICKSSPEWRMLIIGVAVTFSIAIDAWQNIFIYPASEAPRYPRLGYKVSAAYSLGCCLVVLLMKYFVDGKQVRIERGSLRR